MVSTLHLFGNIKTYLAFKKKKNMVINESLVEFTTIVHIVHDKQKGAILLLNESGRRVHVACILSKVRNSFKLHTVMCTPAVSDRVKSKKCPSFTKKKGNVLPRH